MFKASANIVLPTSIIGSLPRPHWYDASLGTPKLSRGDGQFALPRAVRGRGLVIPARAGSGRHRHLHRWRRALRRRGRRDELVKLSRHAHVGLLREGQSRRLMAEAGRAFPRGHILHDYVEARVLPRIVGPVGPGDLQYAELWKTAQRLTKRPVKFGTILPELLAASVEDEYYKDVVERTWAFSDVLNAELNQLADAGCPVIQMEEPFIHSVPARGKAFGKLDVDDLVKIFNNTTKGLRAKTEVWCHTCWGNPCQQRIWTQVQSYQPTLEALNTVDADALTFETCSVGTGDLKAIGTTHQGQEDRHRRRRSSHVAGRTAGGGRRAHSRGAQVYRTGAADHLVGLRNGPRRNGAPPRRLQDGVDRAGHEYRQRRNSAFRRPNASRRTADIRSHPDGL